MKLLLLTASSLLAGRGHALHAGLAEHDAYPHRETDFAATHASSSLLGGASDATAPGQTYSHCQQGQNCETNPYDTTDCNGCANSGTCPSDHGFGFMTGNICGIDGNQPPCYAVALEAGVNMYCPSGWAATQFCSSGSQQNCPNPSGTSGTLYEGGNNYCYVVSWLYCSFYVGDGLGNPYFPPAGSPHTVKGSTMYTSGSQKALTTGTWGAQLESSDATCMNWNGQINHYVVTGACSSGSGTDCQNGGANGYTQCSKLPEHSSLGTPKQACSDTWYPSANSNISPKCPEGSIMVSAGSSGSGANQKCGNEQVFTGITCAQYTAPLELTRDGGKYVVTVNWISHPGITSLTSSMSATTSSSNTATKSVSSAYSKALEESAEFSFKEGNEEAGASASASFGYKLTTSATNTVENTATTLQGTQNGTITGTSVECPAGNLFQLQFSSPTNKGGESALLNSMWRCIPNVAPSFGPGASCPNSYPCCIDPTYCAGKDACCNECHPSNDGGNPTIPYYGCTDYETSKTCTVDDPSSCSWACPDLSGSLDGGSIGSHTRQQWIDTIDGNLNAGRPFLIGLPQTWWWGKTASETKQILQTCHPAAGQ